jgi:nickel transport protein
MRHQRVLFTALCILLSPIFISPCYAHKVRVFAWAEGETIHTESKFSGGKALQNGTITVEEDLGGAVLLTGKTDKSGLFQFQVPKTSSPILNIVINSGDGHKGSWKHDLGEVAAHLIQSPGKVVATEEKVPAQRQSTSESCISKEELSAILDTTLEAKLAPIRRTLAEESEKKVSIQDVLGGLGYILGLAGIAAYMKSRKETN